MAELEIRHLGSTTLRVDYGTGATAFGETSQLSGKAEELGEGNLGCDDFG